MLLKELYTSRLRKGLVTASTLSSPSLNFLSIWTPEVKQHMKYSVRPFLERKRGENYKPGKPMKTYLMMV